MRNSARNGAFAIAAALAVAIADPAHAAGSPSPAATASASTSAAATTRTAIVSCRLASLVAWPDRHTEPSGTSYPPARLGDAVGVIGSDALTPDGENLTETTIDVVAPFGSGKHYWIATRCIT